MSRTGTRIPPIPTLLSELKIDVDKDWNNKAITNMKSLKLNEVLYADVIRELTSGARVSLPDGLKTDIIREYTSGEGVDADHIRSIPASYVIEIKDGTVIAHPCRAGLPRYEGKDATTVIQQAINALTPGRTWKEKVVLKGVFNIDSPLSLPSYTILEIQGKLMVSAGINGIEVKGTETSHIVEVEILGGTLVGAGVESSLNGIHLEYVDNFIIKGCSISGFGTGEDGAGIYVANSKNGVISCCIISNCRNGYLTPQLTQGHVSGVCIQNNYFYNLTDDAIHPQRGRGNLIVGNVVDTFGDDGIDLYGELDSIVADNVVINGAENTDGIEIGDGSHHCVVAGNSIYNCFTGIHVYKSNYVKINGNNVSNNSRHGIWLNEASYCVVQGNCFENNGYYGIVMGGSHNLIEGNLVANNGYWGIYGTGDYNAILHNIVKDNSAQGIHPAGNYWAIEGNEVIEEAGVGQTQTYGIRLEGTGHIVKYNRVIAPTPISVVTGSHTIKFNDGYVTENSGTATIPAGSTKVTVSHGLAATPSKVLVTPIGDPGDRYWVENITSTSFDIVVATAPAADIDFCWQAEV